MINKAYSSNADVLFDDRDLLCYSEYISEHYIENRIQSLI